ncbi:MAG: 23S rRNA (uracil(1939)-C(5))-methyltransferase RlmD [Elusimicrobia bacterium]|nr:23S rRNA (uracil(1939)-C(5))-methyltransferase RlmD [Elusimicrobiota bacterium]MBD3411970.1 23S rRNA (uracil(1939)-C(5))-methyltransferase RlmD [Elusimicrobiota bacterium]
MCKNKRAVCIEKIVPGGDGFAVSNGKVVFVPYSAPGDEVLVSLYEEKKDYCRGMISAITKPSPVRHKPPCPYFFDPDKKARYKEGYYYCGGCDFQHITYAEQMRIKEQILKESLRSIGGFHTLSIDPIKGMPDPWRYRNKIQLPVAKSGGKILIGFYKPRSHTIVDSNDCLIQDTRATKVVEAIRTLLVRFRLEPYQEHKHSGWLKHILLRTARFSDSVQLMLITRTGDFARKKLFIRDLVQQVPLVSSIYQNINPGKTNVIVGSKTLHLWGEQYCEERIGPVRYYLEPDAFFQVNPEQTEQLYRTVSGTLALNGTETLYDLYCGSGGIGLYCAKQAGRVIGIDDSKASIRAAQMNARINAITNARFIRSDAQEYVKSIKKDPHSRSLIILDPPRKGCSDKLLTTLARLRFPIMYVSCNPATLARDMALLAAKGYQSVKIVPFDFFPQTAHIETMVFLVHAGH